MDRNNLKRKRVRDGKTSLSARRAWIEIMRQSALTVRWKPSLSARRAWIEIMTAFVAAVANSVALRKESVDRNSTGVASTILRLMSLSARRAWIEMIPNGCSKRDFTVALRKESVDRNAHTAAVFQNPVVALRKESVDRNLA